MHQAPVLATQRLVLRPHTRDDYETLHAMWSDAEVVRYIGGQGSSRQDSWFRLMRYLGHWPLMGYGYFALCDKETGAYIGDVGIANHQRGLHPEFDDAPETGWVLSPAAFGKGYATEAMGAILDWYEETYGPTRSVCMIQVGNDASMRVAAKLGYRVFQEVDVNDAAINLLSRP